MFVLISDIQISLCIDLIEKEVICLSTYLEWTKDGEDTESEGTCNGMKIVSSKGIIDNDGNENDDKMY